MFFSSKYKHESLLTLINQYSNLLGCLYFCSFVVFQYINEFHIIYIYIYKYIRQQTFRSSKL